MPRDEEALLDIYQAALDILEFREGVDRETFSDDRKTQSAIVHQLLIIGEATKRLSDGFREEHPSFPWRSMSGMRDRLIHDYNNVDLDEVWRTAKQDIPGLVDELEPLVPEEDG
jgi:uncharacterized protein with HEPN domain